MVLADLEVRSRLLGYRTLRLETGIRQPEAIRIYERGGYRRIERYGKYVANAESVCFEKAPLLNRPRDSGAVAAMAGYTCRVCDKYHDELTMHYGAAAPYLYYTLPEQERERRCLLSSDQCVIDEKHFFIVGNLELPVIGIAEKFSWDVWVSLSRENFARAYKLWKVEGREAEPPYFGWLNTLLPGYPETLHLKTHVHTRAVGGRPLIELEPTDHALAVEQREGITRERVQEIAEIVQHGNDRKRGA